MMAKMKVLITGLRDSQENCPDESINRQRQFWGSKDKRNRKSIHEREFIQFGCIMRSDL